MPREKCQSAFVCEREIKERVWKREMRERNER